MYKKLNFYLIFLLFNSICRLAENQLNGNMDADIFYPLIQRNYERAQRAHNPLVTFGRRRRRGSPATSPENRRPYDAQRVPSDVLKHAVTVICIAW